MDGRKAAKALAATAVDGLGVRRWLAARRRRQAGGRRVVVLGYHRVCRDFEAARQGSIESCLISRETFRRHVAFLATHFELATMSRAVEVLARRATAMRDVAVITFDDGYADVLENALPVLREYGAPATMYVSSGVVAHAGHFPHDRLYALLVAFEHDAAMRERAPSSARRTVAQAAARGGPAKAWLHELIRDGSPAALERLTSELAAAAPGTAVPTEGARALDWDGVRALDAAGVEIGAHTVAHAVLTHLDAEGAAADLRESREAVERALGKPVRHFSYCNGYWNRALMGALRRTGYASAVTTEDRLNRLGDDPLRLARRVLWEKSAWGPFGRTAAGLLACQLDDAWSALGFTASEDGARPEPGDAPAARERELG